MCRSDCQLFNLFTIVDSLEGNGNRRSAANFRAQCRVRFLKRRWVTQEEMPPIQHRKPVYYTRRIRYFEVVSATQPEPERFFQMHDLVRENNL